MAENSKIEWCHHTFNPWVGCTKVSPACDHCYAESWAKRTGQAGLWAGERRLTSVSNWRQPLKWDRAAKAAGERHRVFCASLADVFDNQAETTWREALWERINQTQNLDWLLLTKRPQNIAKMLPEDWRDGYPNVWLGTTVENQTEAKRRIPHLLAVPARIHFLSCEPLLGEIDLESAWSGESALDPECWGECNWCRSGLPPLHNCRDMRQSDALREKGRSGVDWVICGGESGPGARAFDEWWAERLMIQCRDTETAFFMKQMFGVRKPLPQIPDRLMVRQFPA